jgi:hypothetical protein
MANREEKMEELRTYLQHGDEEEGCRCVTMVGEAAVT